MDGIPTFKRFFNDSVSPNELKKGDKVKNTNPECKHYKSEGEVTSVRKIKQKGKNKNVAGNIVKYKVTNKGKRFKDGDDLEKTEVQLDKK